MSATVTRSETSVTATSPQAQRSGRPTWRDPRLAVGLLLMAGSVVVGASLVGGDATTTEVLALRTGVAVGTELDADDLTRVPVHFASAEAASRYLSASDGLPDSAVLVRPVAAGELLPRAAVGVSSEVGMLDVPLPVSAERVATGVRSGSTVDVWVSPGDSGDAERLLQGVPVRSVGRTTSGSGLRQVVVAVPQEEQELVARLVARLDPQRVLVALRRN